MTGLTGRQHTGQHFEIIDTHSCDLCFCTQFWQKIAFSHYLGGRHQPLHWLTEGLSIPGSLTFLLQNRHCSTLVCSVPSDLSSWVSELLGCVTLVTGVERLSSSFTASSELKHKILMQNNTPQPRWISFLSISIGGRNMTLCFSTRVGKWHIARLRHWGILIQICPHKSGLWQHERLWPTTSHPTSHTHTSHFTAVTKLCVLFILSAGRLAGVAGSVQSSSAELEQYHHHTSRDQATLLTGWQCCSIYIKY